MNKNSKYKKNIKKKKKLACSTVYKKNTLSKPDIAEISTDQAKNHPYANQKPENDKMLKK
jgi:hypothetical protein